MRDEREREEKRRWWRLGAARRRGLASTKPSSLFFPRQKLQMMKLDSISSPPDPPLYTKTKAQTRWAHRQSNDAEGRESCLFDFFGISLVQLPTTIHSFLSLLSQSSGTMNGTTTTPEWTPSSWRTKEVAQVRSLLPSALQAQPPASSSFPPFPSFFR